jgi:flagellar motor switch protein FliM
MEHPLSQADIDALMRALAGGEDLFQTKGQEAKPYDFRRPTKFKKDLLRTLVMIHDSFARLLQSVFLANLRTRAQLHVRGTSQYSFTEYLQLLPNPTVAAAFRMDPLPGTCLLEISQNIAYAIIDRVFGGTGADEQPQRALSEIEVGVMQRVFTDMLQPLAEAWRNVAELQPTLDKVETNPLFLQSLASSEVVAVITIGVEIGEHMGHMALALPHATVEPLLQSLSARNWVGAADLPDEADRAPLEQSINQAPVDVDVVLSECRMTVGDFMQLGPGAILPMPTRVSDEVTVYVGNRRTYVGRPGMVGNKLAVQISREIPAVGK